MEILKGIGWSILVITILKFIHYRYFRDTTTGPLKFDLWYWVQDNWMDYVIQVGVAFMVVSYSHEIIDLLNQFFEKTGIGWVIPHFEDVSFYWLLAPVITALLLYKFGRKKIAIPTQQKVAPNTKN